VLRKKLVTQSTFFSRKKKKKIRPTKNTIHKQTDKQTNGQTDKKIPPAQTQKLRNKNSFILNG
jgi:hypothetical protein